MSRTSVHDDVPHSTTKYELFSDASEPKARAAVCKAETQLLNQLHAGLSARSVLGHVVRAREQRH